jgi:hypothetical protein
MIGRVYVCLIVSLCTQVQKDVGLWQHCKGKKLVVQPKEVPYSGQKHDCACSHEAEEEYDDKRMLVIHQIMAQAGATVGDAAICEGKVEFSECRGYVDKEEAVEKPYRRIPVLVKTGCSVHAKDRHLKAGSRPKKAINVTRDTVTVKTIMVRATVMMGEGQVVAVVAWWSKEKEDFKRCYCIIPMMCCS